tara:strand:- start:1720 stop:2550 length:831 start_codon:yes stop_codon:yes gene_type:complete
MQIREMSRSQLERLWKEKWGQSLPTGRLPVGSKLDQFYIISDFYVAIQDEKNHPDEGKPIAFRGYGYKGEFKFIGMAYTKPEYYRQGIYTDLEPSLSGKVILALSQRNPEFPQDVWVNYWKFKGFLADPTDEQLDRVFDKGHEEVTAPFINYYRNKPDRTWVVRNTNIRKAWFTDIGNNKNNWRDIVKSDIKKRKSLANNYIRMIDEIVKGLEEPTSAREIYNMLFDKYQEKRHAGGAPRTGRYFPVFNSVRKHLNINYEVTGYNKSKNSKLYGGK